MTIQKIQLNTQINPLFRQQKEYKSYLEAENPVNTENNVKPLPPKGHLVDDTITTGTKYFFKDIGYDMKSVKEGYLGTANDHKLGRLNDVGLRLGGIGIAAYLASRTANTKARIMEYVGLATFLTAMAVYPKLAINAPARLLHGYDIDKEYIDDQGRKKSVQQDSNYVPYDMYLGQKDDEDLDKIGDKMGIPRDIKNRHDVIREQMRKIATQNNTLWMLTAGFATPLITALACSGLENYVIAPSLAKTRNNKANTQIINLFNSLKAASESNEVPEANKLSKEIENILSAYRNAPLPDEEKKNIIDKLTKGLKDQTADSVKKDLEKILPKNGTKTEDILKNARISANNGKRFDATIPTAQEFDRLVQEVLNDTTGANKEKLFSDKIKELISSNVQKKGLTRKPMPDDKLVKDLTEGFIEQKSHLLSSETISKITDFAKIMGELKENSRLIDSCTHFKFEAAPETIIARSSAKFEKEFLSELGISHKELKKMGEDEKFARELLDKKFTELAKNKEKFERMMRKLAKISAEMDVNLNGGNDEQIMLKLINAIEYLYNGTASKLEKLDGFKNTIETLVGNKGASDKLMINDAKELFGFLDGTIIPDLYEETVKLGEQVAELKNQGKNEEAEAIERIIKEKCAVINNIRAKIGAGSDRNNAIVRILDRYHDTTSNFNRIMHTLDTYKRLFTDKDVLNALSSKKPNYICEVLEKCKDTLLETNANAHFNKLDTKNAPGLYIDVMNALYRVETNNHKEGIISEFTNNAMKDIKTDKDISFVQRFKKYIGKFRYLMGNHKTNFMESHMVDVDIEEGSKNYIEYSPLIQTNNSKSAITGQSPVEYARNAAIRKYNNQKWGRIIGGILGSVLAVTLIAQFGFGKLRNPKNLQKQVKDDSNK